MSQNQPLVSIMMPVYNGIDTLGLATNSLIQQSYTNWKCVIVNDGSSDGTKEFLDQLTDPRFVIIHFEANKGRPVARQAALDAAEGEYLAFLDADDFYHPEKLKEQIALLEQFPEVALVSCGNACYDENFNLETVRGCGNGVPKTYRFGAKLTCALRTSVVRLAAATKIPFNAKLKHAQDTDFMQRYLVGKQYISMPQVLYYYSEFVSVTGKKILKTYYYSLIHHRSLLKHAFVPNLKAMLVTVAKGAFTAVLLPFTGVGFFLKKRGRIPTLSEQEDYKKVSNQLQINGKA
ncbi:glycosyltransferase family 2 protein [Nubsella zeaxanthinifaciens]|jgi:glycosyltransferase involved in cell wall biosynthesis|uniref:glycosyltransferase family 2 protein n=1 Tax=Nubsella zeaxanthinifaciens TaxID=392412 RepID=UPI000DE1FBC8|nr:glycosyltransferase family A protein [Nubsella zeaxanthinifaciens]